MAIDTPPWKRRLKSSRSSIRATGWCDARRMNSAGDSASIHSLLKRISIRDGVEQRAHLLRVRLRVAHD